MPLFVREGGRLTLTGEGALFLPEVEGVFAGLAELGNRAREIRQFRSAQLRVGTIAAGAQTVIPGAVAATSAKYPELRASVFLRSHYRIVEMVAAGRVDVGLCNAVDTAAHVGHPCDFPAAMSDRTANWPSPRGTRHRRPGRHQRRGVHLPWGRVLRPVSRRPGERRRADAVSSAQVQPVAATCSYGCGGMRRGANRPPHRRVRLRPWHRRPAVPPGLRLSDQRHYVGGTAAPRARRRLHREDHGTTAFPV